MYLLGTNYPIAYAFDYIHCAWSNSNLNYASIFYFSGPVPADFSEIPEEWIKNPNVMSKNAVAQSKMVLNNRPQRDQNQVQEWRHDRTFTDPKGNWFYPAAGRWLLGNCSYHAQRTHAGIDRYPEFGIASLDFASNQPRIYSEIYRSRDDLVLRDLYNVSASFSWRSAKDNQEDVYIYNLNVSGDQVPAYPIICEFERPETIDGFYFRQGADNTSSIYLVNDITFEAWDASLNGGQGDWGPALNVEVRDDTTRQLIDFGQTFTTTRMRITGGNDATSGWYPNWLQFTSTTEPAQGKDPIDITWALVSYVGGNQSNADYQDFPTYNYTWWENQQKTNMLMGYPFLLVDVGEPGDDATVILNKSRGVMPFEQLHPLHMGLNFKDA